MFSSIGSSARAVCLRVKTNTQFACASKLAVLAVGAVAASVEVEQAANCDWG